MKEDRQTQTGYSRSIESHWDSTIEFEKLSVSPVTPLDERNPAKEIEHDSDVLSFFHGERNEATLYWDSDIVFEKLSLNPTPRHEKIKILTEETESKWDSSSKLETLNSNIHPLHKERNIDSHWDFAIELERVKINPAPAYGERYRAKTVIVSSFKHILNSYNSSFAIMLITALLSLLGFNRIFSNMLTKRKSNNGEKKRRSQDSPCNKSCSPTKKTKLVPGLRMNTDSTTNEENRVPPVAEKVNILQQNHCTSLRKMDFSGYIYKREPELSVDSKQQDKVLEIAETRLQSVTSEKNRNSKLLRSQGVCEKSLEEPIATTTAKISSLVLSQSSESESYTERENSNVSLIRSPVENDACRRGSSFTEQQLQEMSKEFELAKGVFGVEGAQQFVQQRHLIEYQESMRREYDNQRLISEFQVRQIEMHNTERRHQELMARQEDGRWASKCIQTRNHIMYHLQRTTIWIVVLIFFDKAAEIGLQTIRSDLLCTCQPNPSSLSVKVFLCSSVSPSFLCQLVTTCWIGCASSWVIWVLALFVIRFVGMKFSDTLACGVGMLLWNQVNRKSIYWCTGYICFTALMHVLILIRGHQMQRRLRSSGCQRMKTLTDYELECDQFQIGIVLLMTMYFCFFQVAENGFLQQCARTYISYESYKY